MVSSSNKISSFQEEEMRILLTNDDGIEAKGLCILEGIVRRVYQGAEIFVYAPSQSISGAGRSMTFGSEKYVRVQKLDNNKFKVYGNPADCVEIGCRSQKPIDLIFSGINHGLNLGQDFFVSGTIQAAHHGVHYFGVPAVALSAPHSIIETGEVEYHCATLLGKMCEQEQRKGLININFPEREFYGIRVVNLGNYLAIGDLKVVSESEDEIIYDLLGPMELMEKSVDPTTDVGAVKNGFIAITLHDGAEFFP